MNRVELTKYIEALPIESDSNIKFLTLLRSRLMEEGVEPEYASLIAGCIEFDMSNVPEDDDTLSDIATALAGHFVKVYARLKLFGVNKVKEFHTFRKYFNPFKITVDH